MESIKSPHPQWTLALKQKNTELRCFDGKWYPAETTKSTDELLEKIKKIPVT
jgi:hypothetical protein